MFVSLIAMWSFIEGQQVKFNNQINQSNVKGAVKEENKQGN